MDNAKKVIENFKELLSINHIADYVLDKKGGSLIFDRTTIKLVKGAAKYAEHLRINGRSNGELSQDVTRIVTAFKGYGYEVKL